jgi:4-aminobutyrate aminotransferase-like enzyme
MVGLRLINSETGRDLSSEEEESLVEACADAGVLVGMANSRIRLNPPYAFNPADAEMATHRLERAIVAFEGNRLCS